MVPETPSSSALIKLHSWVLSNQSRVVNVAIVLAVAVLAGVYFVNAAKQKEVAASKALSELNAPMSSAELPEPDVAGRYLALANDFSGTRAAARALLMGASAEFMHGRYAEAQTEFERFLSQFPDSPWIPQASFGVASSLDAQKNTEQAIEHYEDLRRRFPNEHVAEESRLCLGRLYEDSNRLEEAFQIYDEMARANPGGIGAEAGIRREDLVARFPHLAKTNPPAIFPSLSSTNLDAIPIQPTAPSSEIVIPAPPASTNPNPPLQIELPPTP